MDSCSPLRYPGGKQIISSVIATIIRLNNLEGQAYAEPFAGGAGAALSLLYSGYTKSLILNDADPAIAAMWSSVLNDTETFIDAIDKVPLTIAEWRRQKEIYAAPQAHSTFSLGFSAFYLNRVNRSGIIKNAGPIGGFSQNGAWKIDARFNRLSLSQKVRRIASYRRRISIHCEDALDFLKSVDREGIFAYLDPPYFEKGQGLYLNYYNVKDHLALASFLRERHFFKWVMSYDDTPEIRSMYIGLRKTTFKLAYSVRNCKLGSELLISKHELQLPAGWKRQLPELRQIQVI